MPRRGLRPRDRRDEQPPDYKYKSALVSRLIAKMNYAGKKSTAEKIVYKAMAVMEEKAGKNGLELLTLAMENVKPKLEVRPRRVGGATYQVPNEVRPARSVTLAMRWIINSARMKTGRPMHLRLAEELLAASKKEGAAFKKREDTHKMAESNRAFAHYR